MMTLQKERQQFKRKKPPAIFHKTAPFAAPSYPFSSVDIPTAATAASGWTHYCLRKTVKTVSRRGKRRRKKEGELSPPVRLGRWLEDNGLTQPECFNLPLEMSSSFLFLFFSLLQVSSYQRHKQPLLVSFLYSIF